MMISCRMCAFSMPRQLACTTCNSACQCTVLIDTAQPRCCSCPASCRMCARPCLSSIADCWLETSTSHPYRLGHLCEAIPDRADRWGYCSNCYRPEGLTPSKPACVSFMRVCRAAPLQGLSVLARTGCAAAPDWAPPSPCPWPATGSARPDSSAAAACTAIDSTQQVNVEEHAVELLICSQPFSSWLSAQACTQRLPLQER